MRTSRLRRSFAAGASVALATAGLAAFAPTAQAASGEMTFDCTVSILGVQPFKTVADTNLPDTVELGKEVTVGFTATVTAADNIRASALFLYGKKVEGTAAVDTTIGADKAPATATIPLTTIPETANTELVLSVAGSGKWKPTALGKQDVKLAGYTAKLSFPQEGGAAPKTLDVPCVANAATNTVIDTVEVVPATTPTDPTPEPPADVQKTKTSADVKYKKKAKKVVSKVAVANADGTAAEGDVKVVLKKGKKKVGKAVTTTLNKKGKKKVVFKKVSAKGKYTLVVKYKGSETSKKSSAKVKFRIK